jgi:hypothetical protein
MLTRTHIEQRTPVMHFSANQSHASTGSFTGTHDSAYSGMHCSAQFFPNAAQKFIPKDRAGDQG